MLKFTEMLKGNQHKIDKNKNGKVDKHDFHLLRKEEKEEMCDDCDMPESKCECDHKELEELSKDTTKSYLGKAITDRNKQQTRMSRAYMKDPDKYDDAEHKREQRNKGIKAAKNRIEEAKHVIGVTVSDPNHTMVSQRNEKKMRKAKVSAVDKDTAINTAIAYYKKRGMKVHDHNYMGLHNEETKKNDVPFDGPYTTTFKKKNNPNRSPMDAARALAQQGMKKKMKEEFDIDITDEQADSLIEMASCAPVAPVPDKKYIKGTPENKALKAARKPINGMPTGKMKEEVELDEAAWGKDKMANLRSAHDRHMEKALVANKAGNDEAVKVHQSKMAMIKNKMNKLKQNEEVEQIEEATVDTKKYSWGTMKTVHHGSSFNIPLHPEHHQAIAKLKDQQEHNFKTEDGKHWTAKRDGDKVHFQGANNGGKTSVAHSTMQEAVIDEAKPGLYANINAKRKRIEAGSGERMRKPGSKGAPSASDFKDAAKTAKESVEHIDELSTNTLNAYKDKVYKDYRDGKPGNSSMNRITGVRAANKRLLKKEEVESLEEANHREFASQGKMHPDMAKHMKTGEHMDYYEPKTGDKVHGKVMKNDGKEVHVKQTHDSYNPKKVGTVHKFIVSNKLDESNLNSQKEENQLKKFKQFKEEIYDKLSSNEESIEEQVDDLDEMEFDKSGKYVHKGKYGTSYQGDDDEDDDKPKKPAPAGEKRGRGRPAGSTSGAKQKGSGPAKKRSGVEYTGFKLHLPNNNR